MAMIPKNNDDHSQVPVLPPPSRETGMTIDKRAAIEALAREIGTVRSVAARRSDPDREHQQMLTRLDNWATRMWALLPQDEAPPPPSPEPVTADEISGLDMRVLRESYGWAITVDGDVLGLTAGDMGYEPTGIRIDEKDWKPFKEAEQRLTQLTRDYSRLNEARIQEIERAIRAEAKVTDLEAQLADYAKLNEARLQEIERAIRAEVRAEAAEAELSTLKAERAEQEKAAFVAGWDVARWTRPWSTNPLVDAWDAYQRRQPQEKTKA